VKADIKVPEPDTLGVRTFFVDNNIPLARRVPWMTAEAVLIQLNNIERYYDVDSSKSFVLRRITVEVQEGEFVTVIRRTGEYFLDGHAVQKLNQEGTTIIQVTHSDANAACGNRTIYLRDGWLVDRSRI